ncbi:MAG: hypothetical protein PVH88_04340 [Ignavibacteria bacterium]|jgi:hypothetical protein
MAKPSLCEKTAPIRGVKMLIGTILFCNLQEESRVFVQIVYIHFESPADVKILSSSEKISHQNLKKS